LTQSSAESYFERMDSVIGIAIVALLVILVALATAALRPDKSTAPETSQSSVSSDDNLYAEEDAQFENELSKRVPDIAERFYTKVVGITFENEQGITGEMLIGYCKQFDFLQLVPEPNNHFDPSAIAVCLEDRSRIGHLASRTAQEISRDIKRGCQWRACVKLAKRASSRRRGCLVLCLIRTVDKPGAPLIPSFGMSGFRESQTSRTSYQACAPSAHSSENRG